MTIIQPLTAADVESMFIRAELASPRFRDNLLRAAAALGVSETELHTPAIASEPLKKKRNAVLVLARPGIMNTLPVDTTWQEVLLTAEEWGRMHYINDEPWVAFSNNTRLVSQGAFKILSEPNRTIHQRVLEIHEQIQHGKNIEKIILLADPKLTKLVIVEGHVRATSYVALGLARAAAIPVVLGTCQHPETWALY
jgi:hypothetical protein